jgi:hypothetical protein
MPLPATGPVTDETLPGVPATEDLDADELERRDRIVGAVNEFLRGLPIAGKAQADTQEAADLAGWPDRIIEGGVMLIARLWRRKDTPGGVAVLGDQGPVYVRRNDPDVALLLEIGEHGKPRVG